MAAVTAQAAKSVHVAAAVTAAVLGPEGVEARARCRTGPGARDPLCARALSIWPGLDRTQLTRTHGDPRKLARLVARRTIHSEEAILTLLGCA